MSRTRSRNSPKTDINYVKYARGVGLLLLMLLSLFSVYSAGVQQGMREITPTSQLSSQVVPTNTDVPPSTGNHRLQTSPPDVVKHILDVPQGEAQALPSIRVETKPEDRMEHGTQYGGEGDKQHLGGFTTYDGLGVSPATWNFMMDDLGVQSIMDVGCGKGVSTLYFLEQGADVLCVEGSHDAVEQTLLPDPEKQIVEHDFSRGPYWPGKTYDAVWSVEFLEHVGRNFQYNYIKTFRKAALIFVTHSRWGGWHHVEVHLDEYWKNKFQLYGFQYSEALTKSIREVALTEMQEAKRDVDVRPESRGPNGEYWNGQHIWLTMMVFVNPAVASLPEHAHLLAEPGCYGGRTEDTEIVHAECTKENESKLPESYKSLKPTKERQQAWFSKVKSRIDAAQ